MTPFTPKGDQARWRTIYALLSQMNVDDILTYQQMTEALDVDDRHALQMAMRRAAKELEEVNKHAVEVVPNIGYKIVDAPAHLILAKRQQRRAGKALARGHSKVVNVDLSEVEPEVRSAFQVVAQAFSMQMEMNRRFDTRQRKLETAVREINEQTARSEEELAALRARIERLESADRVENQQGPGRD